MTHQALIDLIGMIQVQRTESQTLELKAAHIGCPKRLYDTLSSFSNQDGGGILVFGISEQDSYGVVGVYDPQDLQKKVNEQCKQMVPPVRPVFTVVSFGEEIVVSAEIPGIDISERPCYYGGVGKTKGSYIRVGESDEPMSDYEIYSYEAFRKKYEDDIRVNERSDESVLDREAFTQYIERIKLQYPKLSRLPDADIYRHLNLVVQGKLTLVCTLLFSLYPQMFYPQYTINAMVVFGNERGIAAEDGARFLDNRRIEGTIQDMLAQSLNFLQKNMKVKTIIDKESGKRNDKPEYPVIALREALLNALIHRDYSIHTQGMPIEVIMYSNRIEIRNPGGLYGRLTVDDLGRVQPDARNPVLARALEFLGITENRYSGIPTMRHESKEAGLREPEFKNSRQEFLVTFYNARLEASPTESSDQERKILEFCRQPKSRDEIAHFLGFKSTRWAMSGFVSPLLKAGRLRMTLPDTPKSKNQKYYTA